MKPRHRSLLRAALGIAVACTILVLGRSISMASDPLCSPGSNSGTVCYIDSNGCEVQQGIGQSNFCNSGARGDGGIVIIQHVANSNGGDGSLPAGQFSFFASSGASAYATLYCSASGQTSVFQSTTGNVTSQSCGGDYPIRSVCGITQACMQSPY